MTTDPVEKFSVQKFSRFKYAEEHARRLDAQGHRFRMWNELAVSHEEYGDTYVYTDYLVEDLGKVTTVAEDDRCHDLFQTGRRVATYKDEPRKWRDEWVRCQGRYGHLGNHHYTDGVTRYMWARYMGK